jgi:hypothetical protein
MRNACKKIGYNFTLAEVKDWLKKQAVTWWKSIILVQYSEDFLWHEFIKGLTPEENKICAENINS